MKRNDTMFQMWLLTLLIWVGGSCSTVSAQYYQIGDVYTFEDGSRGVVFYVDPDNPRYGWTAALQDLDGKYALWTSQCPSTLRNVYEAFPYNVELEAWQFCGMDNTRKLKDSGESPAADAMDVDHGWYIPDAMQLRLLYGRLPILKSSFENAGGDISSFYEEKHWSSSKRTYYSFTYLMMTCQPDGGIGSEGGTNQYLVRPVRDFYDQPVSYWADEPVSEEMSVQPNATTEYDALVVYRFDTLTIKSKVTVFDSYDSDTLREQTVVSDESYTSSEDPSFTGIDVSVPGEYVFRHWESTQNGCDSVITLVLQVEDRQEHVDTLCAVQRDTTYYEVQFNQVIDNQIYAACMTFTGIDTAGDYVRSDTIVGSNGCDSIVTVVLTVLPCHIDFSVVCPPTLYDTLFFGDCVMKIYPEKFGVPSVVCEREWPFAVINEIPEDSLFSEGEHLVKWVVTDEVCGVKDSCEQQIIVVFPKCPDAVDCEGNVYHGVRIGCDCWTQRNLESTKYSDCVEIPQVYAYSSLQHPDTAENVAVFGRLYSYDAAVRDSADNGYGHIQGICPEGWYLPTPEKYRGLNEYGADALKSPYYWTDGGGDNSTGFSALPAGYYNGSRDRYEGLLSETYFWSTEKRVGSTGKYAFLIRHDCDSVLQSRLLDGMGFSVRCVKEKE